MNFKQRLLVAIVAGLTASLLFMFWFSKQSAVEGAQPSAHHAASGNSPDAQLAVAQPAATRQEVTSQDQLPGAKVDLCAQPVVPAFWYYVNSVRAIPDQDGRFAKVGESASVVTELPPDELYALGLTSLDGVSIETALPNGSNLQHALIFSLMQRWQPCALARGEDLRGAAITCFDQVASGGLAGADPALLSLSSTVLRHFSGEEDSHYVAPSLLGALRGILPEETLNYKQQVQPVVRLLASLGSAHAWLRPSALALVEEPWMTKSGRAAYLMQLTAGGTYAEWAVAINDLINRGSDAAKWGAVEAIRGFATPLQGTEPRMQPDQVVSALPTSLYYHSDTTLRWAVYELVCEYGGEPGRQVMLSLLADTTCPDRAGVLSFLCFKSKISGGDCASYLADPDESLRDAAVDGLGHLATKDPATLELLRGLMRSTSDVEMRRLVVKSLGISGAAVLDDLKLAARDPEAVVQKEAVRQIGVLPNPQPELLATLASDQSLAPAARSEAYSEWLLDAPNADVEKIFGQMVADADPEIHEQGYLWTGASALAKGDAAALERWQNLAVPSTLLAKADVLSESLADSAVGSAITATFDGSIRDFVSERIQRELTKLRSPLTQQTIRDHDTLLAFTRGSEVRSVMLDRRFAVSKRILAFLDDTPSK